MVLNHALLHAWWLETVNRLKFRRATKQSLLTWTVLAGAAVLFFVVLFMPSWWPSLLQAAASHLSTVGILLALQASIFVHRGRQVWTAAYTRGWLATVPLSRQSVLCAVALRSLVWPLSVLACLSGAIWITSIFAKSPAQPISILLGVCLASTAVGSMLGWWMPRRTPEQPRLASHYAIAPLSMTRATLSGLSRWPLSQTKVWLQPRSMSRILLLAMLALPANVSGNLAVGLLALFVATVYLSVLLRATVFVAREGANWLRPTPLSFGQFAWAVLCHPLLKQLQWTSLTAGFVIAAGSNPALAIRVAEGWLAAVSVISSIATTHAYYSRAMGLQMMASVGALAALDHFKQHLALPCALLFSAWQYKRAVRT